MVRAVRSRQWGEVAAVSVTELPTGRGGRPGRSGNETSSTREFDRVPPQDLDAEQSVLGSMLLSKDAIADVVETITGVDFYRPAHEAVFEAVLELYARGEPADAITVGNELERTGALARVGGFTDGIGRVGRTPLGCEETELAIRVVTATGGGTITVTTPLTSTQVSAQLNAATTALGALQTTNKLNALVSNVFTSALNPILYNGYSYTNPKNGTTVQIGGLLTSTGALSALDSAQSTLFNLDSQQPSC